MRRVLVTGAAGFLGHHLCEHLLRATDWEVVALVSFRHRGCPLRLAHLQSDKRFFVVYHDLRAPINPRLAGSFGEITDIVHAAAESHVDRSIADPVPFIRNNVDISLHMLDYARGLHDDLRTFIQISTDEVYGPAPTGYEHVEWDPIKPSNPYASSKAAQEAMAFAFWRTYNTPVTVVNGMNVIGERQHPEKFIPMVMRSLLDGREATVHGEVTPDGAWKAGSRFYMHAASLADATRFLMERTPARYVDGATEPDRYHVVGEEEVDNYQMAASIADLLGKPLRVRWLDFHSTRPGHDRRYALDGSKIAALGWTPKITLWDSLAKTVRWTMAHPEWLH